MKFPHKAYDEMVAAERAAEIPAGAPGKKEEVKKEESVFDQEPEADPESETDPEPEGDPAPEGGE